MKNKIGFRNTGLFMCLAACLMFSGCGNGAKDGGKDTAATTAAVSEETTEKKADTKTVNEAVTEAEVKPEADTSKLDLADGEYLADFDTDSSMFHINEMYDNKGLLTVKDGKGTIYIVMPSTKIQQLYLGLAEDAKKDGAQLIDHTVESVTYDDGLTEDANAFEVPVPVLDEEFDLALIGEKGKWYDHKVKVSNPVPAVEEEPLGVKDASTEGVSGETADTVNITLEGGTGKASIKSPAEYTVKDDTFIVTLEWSSPHYDYMIVDGVKYTPVNTEGNSVFEIPFKSISEPVTVIADTTAMSTPHEIEYTITFN